MIGGSELTLAADISTRLGPEGEELLMGQRGSSSMTLPRRMNELIGIALATPVILGSSAVAGGEFQVSAQIQEVTATQTAVAGTESPTGSPVTLQVESSVWQTKKLLQLLSQPMGSPVDLTRAEAIEIVKEAFGRRPDLPEPEEFKVEVRELLGRSIGAREKRFDA